MSVPRGSSSHRFFHVGLSETLVHIQSAIVAIHLKTTSLAEQPSQLIPKKRNHEADILRLQRREWSQRIKAIPVGNGHQTKTQWIKILNANFAYASTKKIRRESKSK